MQSSKLEDISITRLSDEYANEAFLLACKVFVQSSVLHTAVGADLEEYQHYMRPSYDAMIAGGLSTVAINSQNNSVIACLIACDYNVQSAHPDGMPESAKPINALLNSLDAAYRQCRQIENGQYMLVDMATVHPAAEGRGIYTALRQATHQLGREAGFQRVVGELSSAATQQVCIKHFGHKVRAEIEYDSFRFEGQKPFAMIKQPKSIQLVEGELTDHQ